MQRKDKILISIVGPTAIGKTAISIKIAKLLNTEIISSDSRQFYKELKIGTAAPTKEELSQAKHYFIGNLSIEEDYSVGDFEKDALNLIEKLFENKNQIIMVGGSGLYEKAVNEGLDVFPDVDKSIKEELIFSCKEKGLDFLTEKLKTLDPEYYSKVDLNNSSRVIRALEICIGTNQTYTSFLNKNQKGKRNFKSLKIGLIAPREIIYSRINQRVDKMISQGLVKEVESLKEYRNKNALQTVGYKEIFKYLDGEISLEEAIEEIKKNTRRYAKRQLTWYRNDAKVNWFDYDKEEKIFDFINKIISEN